jgi:cob(I)alamin adenosyltransferase
MKLYTKTGDDGGTGLFGGGRVRKDDLRIEAYGAIDELNAHIGTCRSIVTVEAVRDPKWNPLDEQLTIVQSELFTLGAELATPDPAKQAGRVPIIGVVEVSRLEGWIDGATGLVEPLSTFILPAGHPSACSLHLARTVCRRAERRTVTLTASTTINPQIVIYLNRLGDLLFAWARMANHLGGVSDVPWVNPKTKTP